MADLSYAEISKLLKYDAETGKLYWLPRTADMFQASAFRAGVPARVKCWNSRFAGKEAFSLWPNGYKVLSIHGRRYLAHRVVWFMHHAAWPDGHLDHKTVPGLIIRYPTFAKLPTPKIPKTTGRTRPTQVAPWVSSGIKETKDGKPG